MIRENLMCVQTSQKPA